MSQQCLHLDRRCKSWEECARRLAIDSAKRAEELLRLTPREHLLAAGIDPDDTEAMRARAPSASVENVVAGEDKPVDAKGTFGSPFAASTKGPSGYVSGWRDAVDACLRALDVREQMRDPGPAYDEIIMCHSVVSKVKDNVPRTSDAQFEMLRSMTAEEEAAFVPPTKEQMEATMIRARAAKLQATSWPGRNEGAVKYEVDQMNKKADELDPRTNEASPFGDRACIHGYDHWLMCKKCVAVGGILASSRTNEAQAGDPTVRHVVAWMRAKYPQNKHAREWADEIERVFLSQHRTETALPKPTSEGSK